MVVNHLNPVYLYSTKISKFQSNETKRRGPRQWGWNTNCTQLPFSDCNISQDEHEQRTFRTWDITQQKLCGLEEFANNMGVSKKLKEIIGSYNATIHHENLEITDEPKLQAEIRKLLPNLGREALQLEQSLESPITLLRMGESRTIFMTQIQAFRILANAFFCTFPNDPQPNCPGINFQRLFQKRNQESDSSKTEKLLCILKYFEIMMKRIREFGDNSRIGVNDTIISYERRFNSKQVDWGMSEAKLIEVEVLIGKNIEDSRDMLQLDFGNKYVGGGVLGNGAVMEEIRFSICPELIVARLFAEKLSDDEVIIVRGCERFSKYSGYGHNSFKFEGVYLDEVKINEGIRDTEVVVMDALNMKKSDNQFDPKLVYRELHKCYVGFFCDPSEVQRKRVATGNWGCGAFNGDPELKFIIQWMAASQCKRPGITMHLQRSIAADTQKRDIMHLQQTLNFQRCNNVKFLHKSIQNYNLLKSRIPSEARPSFFQYIINETNKGPLGGQNIRRRGQDELFQAACCTCC